MEVRVLRYFLTIAREGNISAAAGALHLSQPTLSRQIHEMEDQLGTQLFTRGNRTITLTESGRLLRKRAEEIVSLVDRTEAEITRPDEIVSGDIFIGGGESDAMRLLAKIARDLQGDYPEIRYRLHSGNAEEIKERLDKGLLDFGILIGDTDIRTYDYLRLPAVDTWGLLLRRDHPLAAKAAITPEDLRGIPLLCSDQDRVTNLLSSWLGTDITECNIVATYNLIYNASVMVDEGLGCAMTLDKLINTSGDSSLCFRPLEPRLTVSLNMVWKKYQVFSHAAELFLTRVRHELE